MNSELCRQLGIEFPLFAFSHCRDVVVAVSKAGGMGVFGAVTYTPDQLEAELRWIDAHIDGKPYGIDLIVPNKIAGKGLEFDPDRLLKSVPASQATFVDNLLQEYEIDSGDLEDRRRDVLKFARNLDEAGAESMLNVAFSHPVALVANALGRPPDIMIDMARTRGVPVAALVGSKQHAQSQIAAGVDILVAAGGEAGGHCGEIATMVLVPEVLSIAGKIPVLAAGGIVTGSQMAACMAMGAAGAWCGSVWLTTAEAETNDAIRQKMIAATSSDTVRSRSRTGKYSRQLRSAWTEAWEKDDIEPLPMPFQSLISEPALGKVQQLAETGHKGAQSLATYWVGQGVGLMNHPLSAGGVVQEFKQDYLVAAERLARTLEA